MRLSKSTPIFQLLLQVVGPCLIMLMVGALVFFLAEVFYRGPHGVRLCWVLGLFTIAAVLVGRISIEEGLGRAQLFGLALAVATLVAASRLVQFTGLPHPLLGTMLLMALIGIVLFASYRLTWDCTVVDNSRDVTRMGWVEAFSRQIKSEAGSHTGEAEHSNGRNWIPKWQAQSSTPGKTVIWFGLLAIPMFAFGQWFVEPSDRSWTALLFAVYFGAALGLLMTTSLLGLQRYVGRRNIKLPAAVVRGWLAIGGATALVIVLLLAALPAAGRGSSMAEWLAVATNRIGIGNHNVPGKDGVENREDAWNRQVDHDAENDVDLESNTAKSDDAQSNSVSEGESSERSNDAESGNRERNRKSEATDDDSDSDRPVDEESTADESSQTDQGNEPRRADRKVEEDRRQNNQQANQARRDGNQRQENPQPQPERGQQSARSNWLGKLSGSAGVLMRLFGIVAIAVLLWMFRKELVSLFSKPRERKNNVPGTGRTEPIPVPRSAFSSFASPFDSSQAQSWSAARIVNYSMQALEALAREFSLERDEQTTHREFARGLGKLDDQLARYAVQLSDLYGRCAFDQQPVSRGELKPVLKLWRRMTILANQRT